MTLTLDLILAIVAALVLGGWLGWLARGARLERQSFDAQVEAYQRTIKARQAPKHARTEPRAAVPPQMQDPAHPSFRRAAGPAPNRVPAKRMVASAADIAPVFWAPYGTVVPLRPQPGRTSITDTGELRLRAQDFIDKMAADDVEWRAKTGLLT